MKNSQLHRNRDFRDHFLTFRDIRDQVFKKGTLEDLRDQVAALELRRSNVTTIRYKPTKLKNEESMGSTLGSHHCMCQMSNDFNNNSKNNILHITKDASLNINILLCLMIQCLTAN